MNANEFESIALDYFATREATPINLGINYFVQPKKLNKVYITLKRGNLEREIEIDARFFTTREQVYTQLESMELSFRDA